MPRERALLPKILADFLAWVFAYLITRSFLPILERISESSHPVPVAEKVVPVMLGTFPLLVAILILGDLYQISKHGSPFYILRGLVLATVVFAVIYVPLRAIAPDTFGPPTRSVLVTCSLAATFFWLLRMGFPKFYGKSTAKRRVLLVGANLFAIRSVLHYAKENPSEFEVVGIIDDFKSGRFFETIEAPFFGSQSSLPEVVENHFPDTIIVLHDQMEYAGVVMRIVETHPTVKEVFVRAQLPLFIAQDLEMLFVQEIPLLKVYSQAGAENVALWRSLLDRAIALAAIVMTFPIFLVMPIIIRLESQGPIFYRQKRLGLHNQPFWIFKFRSMVADAEKKSGAVLAQKNDPRITRIGRIMRATRIDEIPQLLNVLFGDMSIIGPRPERPEFQHSYLETIPWYPLRSLCKPGITGLAQVMGDYHTSTQRKLLYDVSYLANRSVLLDVRIILSTVVTVLTKSGH